MGNISKDIGNQGEEVAIKYLKQMGFDILEQNFRSSQGEVDIVAKKGEFLVFVEVKSYSFRSYGSPLGAIRRSKKQSLIHAARTYLYKKKIQGAYCRFDVITIYRKHNGQQVIEHYPNAFQIN